MGILTGISSLAKSAVSFYKKATAPADALKASGKLATMTFPDVGRATAVSPTAVKVAKSVGSFAVSALKKVASFAINKPKTAIVTAIAVPASAGVLISSPKSREVVAETLSPMKNIERGKKLGDVIEGRDTLEKEDIVTAGKILGVGAATAGIVYGIDYLLGKDDKEEDKALPSSADNVPMNPIPTGTLPTEKGTAPSASPKAVTPETQVVSAGESKKRKSIRRYTKKTPSINQRVNVIVSNKSSSVGIKQTKKYLNREMLLN